MAFNAGEIAAKFSLDTASVTKALKGVSAELRSAFGKKPKGDINGVANEITNVANNAKNATRHLKDVERIIGGIAVSQGFYRLAGSIENAAASLFTFMGDMEKAQIAFETFLGSEDRAKGFIYNMKDFAAETSFATDQALHLSKQLMAAQFDPSSIRSIMEVLNDASSVSGASAETIDRVVYAMNQMKTKGKVMAEEMRQMANANIPIYRIMAEELGIAQEKIMDIGDLNISGDMGVRALLRGLEKEYKGTAERMSKTVPGAIDNIKDNLLFLGEGMFEGPYGELRTFLNKVQDGLDGLRKTMADKGFGGVFEQLFPPRMADQIRTIIASVKESAKAFIAFVKALQPVAGVIMSGVVQAFSVLGPIITVHLQAMAKITKIALEVVPPLKYLAAAIAALTIGFAAGRALMFLWRITGMGLIASVVAKSVAMLGAAVNFLTTALTKNKLTAILMVVAGALLGIALASKTVVKWLDNVMAKVNQLAGITGDGIFKPEDMDLDKLAAEFNASATGGDKLGEAMDDANDKAKKLKKTIMSFDEVFQMPEPEDEDPFTMPDLDDLIPDIKGEITDNMPETLPLPPFEMPELPDLVVGKALDKFKWPEFPKWTWPQFEFAWPPLPAWNWGPMPQWNWGPLPQWDWPALPEWEWKPMPKWEWPALPQWVVEPIPSPVGVLSPVLSPVLQWMTEWAGQFGKAWEGAWDALRQPVNIPIPGIGPALEGVLKELQEWGKQLQEKWGGLWQPNPKPILGFVTGAIGALGQMPGQVAGVIGLVGVALQAGLQGLGTTIAGWTGTAWESLKQLGTDMAGNWSSSLESIQSSFSAFGEWFTNGWSTMLTEAGSWASSLGSAIVSGLGAAWEGVKQGFSDLGAWMADHWVQILAGIGIAIVGALAIIFAPVTGAVTAATGSVTAIVAGAVALIGGALAILGVYWDEGREAVINFAKGAYDKLDTFFNSVGDKVKDFGKGLKEDWDNSWEAVQRNVGNITEDIKNKFNDWTSVATEKATAFKENFSKTMSELPGKVLAGIQSIPSLFTGIIDKLPAPVTRILGTIGTYFQGLPAKVYSAVTSIPSKFGEVINKVPGLVPKVISSIVKAFAELPMKIWEAIKSIPSKIASVFKDIKLPSFSAGVEGVKTTFKNMTGFANGGIIDKDSIVRVGEGGRREAIVPMDNGNAMAPFADAVAQRLSSQMPQPQMQAQAMVAAPQEPLRPLYVETLIADERGLKELYRKFEVIEASERRRGGGRQQ